MKKLIIAIGVVALVGAVAWFAFRPQRPTRIVNKDKMRVGIVFDAGGKFDRSFNQSAWEGASKARDELGILLKDVEPADTSAIEEAMRAFAAEGYDLIFGIGFLSAPAIKKVAKEYPNINFAIVDSVVELPNISSLVFKEHEGAYLTGMIAAMRSREVNGRRKVGFLGGMDTPILHRFEAGYAAGAKLIHPDIDVIVNYVGNTPTAWNDPAKGKEIAKSQIGKGASVIFAAAGISGNGLFDALKEINGRGPCLPKVENHKRVDDCVYGIGVDSNQNYIVPGQIVTSMLKRVDMAVYSTIKRLLEGDKRGGVFVYGLKNDGVGYALDEYNRELVTQKMRSTIDEYRKKIINGEIIVPNKRH